MQIGESSNQYGRQSSIYPYYKPGDIFERDQAYYEQLQRNTRRQPVTVQGNQSLGYRPVETQYQQPMGQSVSQGQYGYQQQGQLNSTVMNVPLQSQNLSDMSFNQQPSFGQYNETRSPQFSKVQHSLNSQALGYNAPVQNAAYNIANMTMTAEMSSPVNRADLIAQSEENRKLKQRLDDLINFRDQFQDGSEVKKKYHYNQESAEGRTIMSQQSQIQSLIEQVKRNNTDINRYRTALVELQKSMSNIQSVDREIYKQLKNLNNRDQELLDRATSALARGAPREQVAAILERIIG